MPQAIRVRPWPDPIIDTIGHDPRSHYAEQFWLPTLGPTALLFMRHVAHRFDGLGDDGSFDLDVPGAAQALGLGPRLGVNSPLLRCFDRLTQFDLAHVDRDGTMSVRRTLPPVNRRHVKRLPPAIQVAHEEWMTRSDGPRQIAERRARHTAYVLAELGTDTAGIECTLLHLGFVPAVCRDAAVWAQARHHAVAQQADAEARHPSSQPAA